MQNTYRVFLAVSIILLINSCTNKHESLIVAVYTLDSICIDGNLNEAVWQHAIPIDLKENRSGKELDNLLLQTQVLASYDSANLYFAFICKDPDIWASFTQRDDHLWKEEVVEIFIDVDTIPETYVEIEVSPANILFDSYIVDPINIDFSTTSSFNLPGIKTGVNVQGSLNQRDDTDDSWTVEIAIPFEDLITKFSGKVGTETEFKLNFFRVDENQGKESMPYAWSPTGARFHEPSVFGKLIFQD